MKSGFMNGYYTLKVILLNVFLILTISLQARNEPKKMFTEDQTKTHLKVSSPIKSWPIQIHYSDDHVLLISLRDMTGKELYSKLAFEDGSETLRFSPDNKISSGVYFISIETENERFTQKVIVQSE